MKTMTRLAYKQGDICCRENRYGIWEVSHPGSDGKRIPYYSTGIVADHNSPKQSIKDMRGYLTDNNIPEIVALASSGKLTSKVLGMLLNDGGKKVTVASSAKEWIEWLQLKSRSPRTVESYKATFWSFVEFAGFNKTDTPREITGKSIYSFINRTDQSQKRSTKQRYVYSLRSYYDFCSANGYTRGNLAAIVDVNMDTLSPRNKEAKPVPSFTDDEVQRMLTMFRERYEESEHNIKNNPYHGKYRVTYAESQTAKSLFNRFYYVAVKLSYTIGIRLSDIAQLEWWSFSTDDHFVIWTDKSNTRIAIPLSDEAISTFVCEISTVVDNDGKAVDAEALRIVLKSFKPVIEEIQDLIIPVDITYCFPEHRKTSLTETKRSNLSVYFNRSIHSIGIKGKSFHGLRHACMQRWKKHNITLKTIGKLVAHKSESTTKGYM